MNVSILWCGRLTNGVDFRMVSFFLSQEGSLALLLNRLCYYLISTNLSCLIKLKGHRHNARSMLMLQEYELVMQSNKT